MAPATESVAAVLPPRTQVVHGPLGASAQVAVAELVARAAWSDGAKPLSDAALLSRADTDVHLLLWGQVAVGPAGGIGAPAEPAVGDGPPASPPPAPASAEALVGYAHVDQPTATGEFVVSAPHRGLGLGGELAAAAMAAGAREFWAHGDFPPARALAARLDLVPQRRLLVLARPLDAADAAQVRWPSGYHLRAYRPGDDDEGLLRVNAAAFAELPDQGGWTAADLAERRQADWFVPADVLLLCEDAPAAPGSAGRIVGFHWTKRHSPEVGEVYVVGLDPAHQGRGLGRPLLRAGLARLAAAGCQEAVLFVDATNSGAIGLYRSMGFAHQRDDVLYGLAGASSGLAG